MKARRYDAMIEYARIARPRTIMEIGTCRGERAEALIVAAGAEAYYGFDLFDTPPPSELTSKSPPDDIATVSARLSATGAAVSLFKGPSAVTVPAANLPMMDLIFIDGGHSEETVAGDWRNVRGLMAGPVFFDDYWTLGFGGCNRVIDGLIERGRYAVTILDPADRFRKAFGVLETRLVRVECVS